MMTKMFFDALFVNMTICALGQPGSFLIAHLCIEPAALFSLPFFYFLSFVSFSIK